MLWAISCPEKSKVKLFTVSLHLIYLKWTQQDSCVAMGISVHKKQFIFIQKINSFTVFLVQTFYLEHPIFHAPPSQF